MRDPAELERHVCSPCLRGAHGLCTTGPRCPCPTAPHAPLKLAEERPTTPRLSRGPKLRETLPPAPFVGPGVTMRDLVDAAVERADREPGVWFPAVGSSSVNSTNTYASKLRHGYFGAFDVELYEVRAGRTDDGEGSLWLRRRSADHLASSG